VLEGDGRLQLVCVRPPGRATQASGQEPGSLRHHLAIPPGAVLVGKDDDLALRVDAGGPPGLGEEEQREKGGGQVLVGQQGGEQPGEPDSLTAQVDPDHVGAVLRGVSGRVEGVHDTADDR